MLKKPAGRAPEAAARIEATRRRSSSGRSCATASTTPRCTWPTSPRRARDVDFAMRWGFGMQAGPVRAVAGRPAGQQVAQWVKEDIDAGKALSQGAAAGLGVRGPGGRDAAACTRPKARGAPPQARFVPRRARCRCTQRQLFRESVLGAGAADAAEGRHRASTKNDEVRVWTLDGEVLIASITAKLHLISPAVTEGLLKARRARRGGLPGPGDLVARRRVLGRRQPRGADAGVHEERRQGHRARGRRSCRTRCCACATRRCRWSRRCAASRSAAAASSRCTARARVAAMESYIGLVEVGVGLVPGGGGLTYIARRAAEMAAAGDAAPTCCRS